MIVSLLLILLLFSLFMVDEKDSSVMNERTIEISEEEFQAFLNLESKKIHKIRYYYDYNGRTAEIDVFQAKLKGLVLVDFEFPTKEEKDLFEMPDFCLADVTQEEFFAGGILCSKSYDDIEKNLEKFNYSKLLLN